MGTGFVNVNTVSVGTGVLQTFNVVSASQITGVTPASTGSGVVNVTVYATAGNGTCTACFTYNPVPTVSAVTPNSGPLAGGTAVTVTGTNFPTTVDSVHVGIGQLGNLVRVSETQLTGATPASSTSGAVDVTLYSASGGNATCSACFTYNPVPTVSAVTPNSGPLAGGTAVTVTGTNFPTIVDSVRVGMGRLGTFVRVSETQLTGTTPASSTSGAVDVTLYSTSAGNGSCLGCFTYEPTTWTEMTAGSYHTCGVTSSGAAFCWGKNSTWQLGDGSNISRSAPVAVTGGLTFTTLTASFNHTCGLTSSGAAYCWGDNTYGELGDGSTTSHSSPVAVVGGLLFASLHAGASYTCGLTRGGAAYCWGYNLDGRLGDSSTTSRSTPVAVAGGLAFASLTTGGWHACGLTNSGAAYCWGQNQYGELGDSTTANSSVPVPVAGGLSFTTIAGGGGNTCALTSSGTAYCWGYNDEGELGDGSTIQRSWPVAVAGGLSFGSVAVGWNVTCGRTNGGTAYCWGWNLYGEVGDGTTTERTTPTAVGGDLGFALLTEGGWHSCGMTAVGAAYCWGFNSSGQLGDGTTTNRTSPASVANPVLSAPPRATTTSATPVSEPGPLRPAVRPLLIPKRHSPD